jgi:hypothetical protein
MITVWTFQEVRLSDPFSHTSLQYETPEFHLDVADFLASSSSLCV